MGTESDDPAKFLDMVRAASAWRWEVDAELRIVRVSEEATAVFGRLPALMQGQSLTALGRLAADGKGEPLLARAHRERAAFRGQLLEIGPALAYRLDGVPVFDAGGSFRGFQGLATAAEDGPAHEQLIQPVNDELADMLRGILHHAKSMSLQKDGPSGYGDYARDIESASRHLMALLTQAATPGSDVEQVGLDVRVAAEEARAIVALGASEKRITVRLEPITGAVVRADRHRVLQILVNLLANAVKFTPEGGHVWVDVETGTADVLIRVCDTGHGIAPEDHELIFARFTKLSPSHEGSGLGLHISRRLAREMGGDLRLESSARGEGARFVLTLPAA